MKLVPQALAVGQTARMLFAALMFRNRRVASLTGFEWDRVSGELLDEVVAVLRDRGDDTAK